MTHNEINPLTDPRWRDFVERHPRHSLQVSAEVFPLEELHHDVRRSLIDTVVEDLPADMFPDRPWGPGDNPKTAVREYLKQSPDFEIDQRVDHKLLISMSPSGYLKRVR